MMTNESGSGGLRNRKEGVVLSERTKQSVMLQVRFLAIVSQCILGIAILQRKVRGKL